MPPTPSHLLVADPAYPRLKAHLIGVTGLAYYADKDDDLAMRIAARLAQLGLGDCASYLALLENGQAGEEELDALIADLTIGETFFFRHRELFDALRETVLPELIERNAASRQLRIWSGGCATGAEPYSVAILLRRDLAARLVGWDVTLVGTDINRAFLAQAREGRFEEWAFRGTPDELRRDCFVRANGAWQIAPRFREGVSFQYHNLVHHPFPSLLNNLFAFDLILCRNVTIYFAPDIVRRLVEHFHQCLVEGGYLLVGHAEPNIETFRAFRTVNARGAVLYQKTRDPGLAAGGVTSNVMSHAPPQAVIAKPPPAPWTPPVLTWQPAPPAALSSPAPTSAGAALPELLELRALADGGAWEEVARRCRQFLERDRLNPVIHFYQALVFEQTGHRAETEQALRRAIYLDRGFTLAHYYLGLLLQKQGRLVPAARAFRNVLELLTRIDPGHVFVDGDGITAADLARLTQMHLNVLDEA
jgi:chemotaxis protein methyltransferase CheR